MKIKAKKLLRYIGWPLAGLGGLFLLFEDLNQLNRLVRPWIMWSMLIMGLLLLVASTEPEKKASDSEYPNPESRDNISRNRRNY